MKRSERRNRSAGENKPAPSRDNTPSDVAGFRSSWMRWALMLIVGTMAILSALWWGVLQSHRSSARRALGNGNLAEAKHEFVAASRWEWSKASSTFGLAQVARRDGDVDRTKELLVLAANLGTSAELVQKERSLLTLQSGALQELHAMQRQVDAQAVSDVDEREAFVIGLAVAGDQPRALQAASRWVDDAPTEARAYQIKARLLSDVGRIEEAFPLFERALELNPKLILAREGIANAAVEMDKMSEALQHFDVLVQQLQDFVPLGDLTILGGSQLFNAKLSRARIFLELKREREAIDQLQTLVHEVPENFMARYLLATEYSEQGQFDQVLQTIEPLHERFPEDVSLNYLLATAESAKGNMSRSSEYMQQYLTGQEQLDAVKKAVSTGQSKPLPPEFYKEAASVYLRYQWDAAQPWLERALAVEPHSPEVLSGLADFYQKMGDKRRADQYAVAAILQSRRQ